MRKQSGKGNTDCKSDRYGTQGQQGLFAKQNKGNFSFRHSKYPEA